VLYPYNRVDITYSYRYIVCTFSDLLVRSPALSSSLRWLDTSGMSLKEVQVANSWNFAGKVYTATTW